MKIQYKMFRAGLMTSYESLFDNEFTWQNFKKILRALVTSAHYCKEA
jgi:hypothetical protein